MKAQTKEPKEKNIVELQKQLVDLARRHNDILEQVASLALDLQVFCKKSKFGF